MRQAHDQNDDDGGHCDCGGCERCDRGFEGGEAQRLVMLAVWLACVWAVAGARLVLDAVFSPGLTLRRAVWRVRHAVGSVLIDAGVWLDTDPELRRFEREVERNLRLAAAAMPAPHLGQRL